MFTFSQDIQYPETFGTLTRRSSHDRKNFQEAVGVERQVSDNLLLHLRSVHHHSLGPTSTLQSLGEEMVRLRSGAFQV